MKYILTFVKTLKNINNNNNTNLLFLFLVAILFFLTEALRQLLAGISVTLINSLLYSFTRHPVPRNTLYQIPEV
ncbi:hypothetical protein PGB90_002149 [Kerria lacca]